MRPRRSPPSTSWSAPLPGSIARTRAPRRPENPACNRSAREVYVRVFVGILLLNLNLISLRPDRRRAFMATESQTATPTQAQRTATAQKAAATRRRNAAKRSRSARKAAATRVEAERNALQAVQAQAERAVLIPVGAALVARDSVLDAAKPYTESRESAEREFEKLQRRVNTNLRKFERRGTTARNRAVREAKRTRTRIERELRQRRNKAVRTVKGVRRDAERQVKSVRRD